METAIRYSRNSLPGRDQRFLLVDVVGKAFKLEKITKRTTKTLLYETLTTSAKVPSFRAFDWHPTNETLIAVGQASGEATLLSIAEEQQDSVLFPVRSQRLCNAVALNSENLLAAGLDRVRTDVCLNIWDFNHRLPAPGMTAFAKNYSEPVHRLASGEPITSLKFFHDDPQLLVAGVKGQFVRLYDLRDSAASTGVQFATRCVHNLAIDWLDENYIASCAPSPDPMISIWDRRMGSRGQLIQSSAGGGNNSASSDQRQPEVSLELRNAINQPGSIWSMRFSKSKRGCLGVLSSTGHLQVYELAKDYIHLSATSTQATHVTGQHWEAESPQDICLDRTQDIEKQFSHPSALKAEKARIVSFDFTTTMSKDKQPELITMTGDGRISIRATAPIPEPSTFEASGCIVSGNKLMTLNEFSGSSEAVKLLQSLTLGEKDSPKQDDSDKDSVKTVVRKKKTSYQRHQAETNANLALLSLKLQLDKDNIMRGRAVDGYGIDPSDNKEIIEDDEWLLAFWEWIEHATSLHEENQLIKDNLDLSYLGVYSIWKEDIPNKSIRTFGPTSARVSKTIESLVNELDIPPLRGADTSRPANRQLCLYLSNLAWSKDLVRLAAIRFAERGEHTKAAFIALVASERDLVHEILTGPNSTPAHKSLSLAIAGSHRQISFGSAAEAWKQSINALADETDEPYALAILAYVKHSKWSTPLLNGEFDILRLYFRTAIALRHLSDLDLTSWISSTTEHVVAEGDIEGILLTGLAHRNAVSLFQAYIANFSDVQTAVLALCPIIPRYLNDLDIVRRFDAWHNDYRRILNSWRLYIERATLDVQYGQVAIDNVTKQRVLPVPPPQIRLVCSYCSASIAHHAATKARLGGGGSDGGSNNGGGADQHAVEGGSGGATVIHDIARNPLTPANAAAIGTVCPKCGRHLPRCGVCDLWLGTEDESWLKWASYDDDQATYDKNADLSGSAHTVVGLEAKGGGGKVKTRLGPTATIAGRNTGEIADTDADAEQKKKDDELLDEEMARMLTFCMNCSHAFHWKHAKIWFEGEPARGRAGHHVCPVPKCQCACYDDWM
ncbi:hypothetical protein DV736_g4899, partial [Chaetothyriales sp. CBS 134916]